MSSYSFYDSDEEIGPFSSNIRNPMDHLLRYMISSRLTNLENKLLCNTDTDRKKIGISLEPFEPDDLLQYYNAKEKRTTFSDISIKVNTQIYHLDKVTLALRSAYFEKLFLGNYEEKKLQEIEIHNVSEDTFCSIAKIIYGHNLYCNDIMNESNFVPLLMAMDYLQMEIDVGIFVNFISVGLDSKKLDETAMFDLFNFVSLLPELKPIFVEVQSYFSQNLSRMSKLPEFLSITPDALIGTLTAYIMRTSAENNSTGRRNIGNICAEWICHDFENRLPHIIDLVNAAKYRYGFIFAISRDTDYTSLINEPDEARRKERVEKYFNKLLNYSFEIYSTNEITENSWIHRFYPKAEESEFVIPEMSESTPLVHKIDYKSKWNRFFKHKYFSDVSIKVGNEVFQLHRIKLSLEIPYFKELFARQSDTRDEYSLDDRVDEASFGKIIKYIYHEEIDLTNEGKLSRLLQTCKILQMDRLIENIYEHVERNMDTMGGNIFDFLSHIIAIEEENVYDFKVNLELYMASFWSEICQEPEFNEISFKVLEYIVTLPNLQLRSECSLVDICSRWILHDVKNRYQLIPELACAINRNCVLDYEQFNTKIPEDADICTKEYIDNRLNYVLISTQRVSIPSQVLEESANLAENPIPCFMISKQRELCIVDANFNQFISIPFVTTMSIRNLSSAIVRNNLFVLFYDHYRFSFLVCNLLSKKINSLTLDQTVIWSNFRLLSCNDELFFCTKHEDNISKYSNKLNRWIKIFKSRDEKSANESRYYAYTSDGKVICKIFKDPYREYFAQLYNFEKKMWINFPTLPAKTRNENVLDIGIVNKNLCVMFDTCTAMYRQKPRKWELIEHGGKRFQAFKQFNDCILYVGMGTSSSNGNVYSYSIANKSWHKKIKLEDKNAKKIIAIHSV